MQKQPFTIIRLRAAQVVHIVHLSKLVRVIDLTKTRMLVRRKYTLQHRLIKKLLLCSLWEFYIARCCRKCSGTLTISWHRCSSKWGSEKQPCLTGCLFLTGEGWYSIE